MRTVVLLRKWAIRFLPINGVANESSARRVASIVPEASITAHDGGIGRNFC
jgi:hypothetical protein